MGPDWCRSGGGATAKARNARETFWQDASDAGTQRKLTLALPPQPIPRRPPCCPAIFAPPSSPRLHQLKYGLLSTHETPCGRLLALSRLTVSPCIPRPRHSTHPRDDKMRHQGRHSRSLWKSSEMRSARTVSYRITSSSCRATWTSSRTRRQCAKHGQRMSGQGCAELLSQRTADGRHLRCALAPLRTARGSVICMPPLVRAELNYMLQLTSSIKENPRLRAAADELRKTGVKVGDAVAEALKTMEESDVMRAVCRIWRRSRGASKLMSHRFLVHLRPFRIPLRAPRSLYATRRHTRPFPRLSSTH